MSAHLDPETIAGLVMVEPTDRERATAEEHARACPACGAAWQDALTRLGALDALSEPPAPSPIALASAKSAVLAKLRAEARSSVRSDPEPEVSAPRPAAIRAAMATPALSIAAFVSLALSLGPIAEVAWGVSLGLLAIVAGRTALALVRGRTRDAGFSLALGAAVSVVLVWIDTTGTGEGHGVPCMAVELVAAAAPLLAAAGLAWRGALRPTALGLAAIAASGALAGQLALRAACPDGHLEHLAVFHLGGVLAAALLGALLAQAPPLRRRARVR